MKRRSLLQGTGFLLGAWGLSSLSRHAAVLAAPTTRKLALLVGINQYHGNGLNGCLTDVELQRELLMHRFGFQSRDVLTLTDQKATRSHIESAFTEHLIKQANPGDIVVIHFSGYGSLIKLGNTADDVQPCLMTADEVRGEFATHALPLDTILLLLRSLSTDQVTTVLDTGFSHPGYSLQGNLKVRSLPAESMQLAIAETTFQDQLLKKANLDLTQAKVQRRAGQMPGVVLSAATEQQFATEAPWHGFQAGLFTYALTQQLWQATPETTLRVSLSRTAELISKRVDQKQQPTLSGQTSRERPLKPYHAPLLQPPADAVVTAIEEFGNVAQLWLGGLPPQVIDQYNSSALFTVEAESMPLLQLYERSGLTAKARFVATHSKPLVVGQRLQEAVRVLPRNLGLSIAIDSRLERIERVDAISAFSSAPLVSAVVAGEQAADYVFGKCREVTQVASTAPEAIALPASSYGLFSQGLEVIPKTLGESGEAVKVAVRRLQPQLQTRLATKLLSLTVNDGSSQLGVRASLLINPNQILMQQQTDRVSPNPNAIVPSDGKLLAIATGSRLQYRLENTNTQPIYLMIVGIDNAGNAFVSAPKLPSRIEAGATVTVPIASPNSEWIMREPAGLAETYLICSCAPFQQAQALLASVTSTNRPFQAVQNLLEVAQAIVQDLHQASEQANQWIGASPDLFALDVNNWATFRFLYQVV
jgi:Caspase domain/Domain of unknown function (DUF4384)